jgi:hypothetical protein
MAGRAERHQAVEIEVRAALCVLDDVVDLEAQGISHAVQTTGCAALITSVPTLTECGK